MTLPVKSLIGLISSNSSRRPFSTNQLNESSCSSMRFGMGSFSSIRAYEIRPDDVRARVDDSATGSMNRSLTEEEWRREGRAHRRSRIPLPEEMSNGACGVAARPGNGARHVPGGRAEHQGGIETAEPERRRQDPAEGATDWLSDQARQQLRDLVVGCLEVRRARNDAVANAQRAHGGLDGAGGAKRMAGQGLGPADRHFSDALSERKRQGPRLGDVADGRGRGMRAHVVDLAGVHL